MTLDATVAEQRRLEDERARLFLRDLPEWAPHITGRQVEIVGMLGAVIRAYADANDLVLPPRCIYSNPPDDGGGDMDGELCIDWNVRHHQMLSLSVHPDGLIDWFWTEFTHNTYQWGEFAPACPPLVPLEALDLLKTVCQGSLPAKDTVDHLWMAAQGHTVDLDPDSTTHEDP